jgi:hypothetical protein
MANRLNVMISSTRLDLSEYRKVVRDACESQGMFPIWMETLPALDEDAIKASMDLVEQADLYIGIFAFRYGYVPKGPKGRSISLTEMEYNRAKQRNIPRFIFLMEEGHPIKPAFVETGAGSKKLEKLKKRLSTERVVRTFTTPDNLSTNVVTTLGRHQQGRLVSFQYVPDIPVPPTPYIAHPNAPFQTQLLVGRREELHLLTDWVAKTGDPINLARVFNIVAAGGMGKSILTWRWFNEIAPQEMRPLVGRLWWSFESKDRFEDFIRCALAYVSGRPLESVQDIPLVKCQQQLLRALDQKPFLIVLDSFERNLIAYARAKASNLIDNENEQLNAKEAVLKHGFPQSGIHSFAGQLRLREANDPLIADFVSKLAAIRSSRILITSRLYPRELQTTAVEEKPGCKVYFLTGLNDDDAVELWRERQASGSREVLLPLFKTFENYPTLIYGLAEKIARYRRKPENIEQWRQDHPEFDLAISMTT